MVQKLFGSAIAGVSLLLLATSALAVPSAPGTSRTLVLPQSAGHSNVISLGTAVDPVTGKQVEGLAIIHPKQNSAKPGGNKGGSVSCYIYLSSGAKWRNVEPWIINPANLRNLEAASASAILSQGVSKWEDATDGVVGNGVGVDVLGESATTSAELVADTVSPDGQNEVYFADITDSNTIAVTIIWGIFGGPPAQRQLVEWDQVYDDVTYDWSVEESGVAGKMDFDNIATHELGHSLGMGDLYNSCIDETMYGYATEGETKKRDLGSGDILGINKLY